MLQQLQASTSKSPSRGKKKGELKLKKLAWRLQDCSGSGSDRKIMGRSYNSQSRRKSKL